MTAPACESAEQLIERRLAALQLAEALGNVAEACRRAGITRTQYYAYKQRYQTEGREGLRNRPPVAKAHPQATSAALVEKLVALALAKPEAGSNELESLLAGEGIHVSDATIHKHLSRNGLGSRLDRWLALESRVAAAAIVPDAEQIAFIEKHNPCFRQRHLESTRPGDVLCQSTLFAARVNDRGSLYLHCVVDTFGSYAFGRLNASKRPEAAVALLHDEVLPYYERHQWPPETILTGHGREFCGSSTHPFELYLMLNGIGHRCHDADTHGDGFGRRFQRTVRNEFFGVALQRTDKPIGQLQQELDAWLHHYNHERPHHGYRNHGLTPAAAVGAFSGNAAFSAVVGDG